MAGRTSYTPSLETRQKISVSQKGKPRPDTPAHRRNLARLRKGGVHSPVWIKDREAYALTCRLRAASRSHLHRTLKAVGGEKERLTRKQMGYSPLELKQHLEQQFTKGMSWKNYGKWWIDHIRPIASFPHGTPASVVNALSNLRPLWEADNRKKKARWSPGQHEIL